jgi:hypothetical protein
MVAVGGCGGKRARACATAAVSSSADELGDDVARTHAVAFSTLMAASWPPTSGATRPRSRARPDDGRRRLGRHKT